MSIMIERRFKDRAQAGEMLALALSKYAEREDVIVLGLPRGGVPVAYEVAEQLHLPLDVLVVRKLGVPGYEELAMGAIASGGVLYVSREVANNFGVSYDQVNAIAARELVELHRREMAYRGRIDAPEVRGKTVVLVDDGIATGATIKAAVRAIRKQVAKSIIIAAPVASTEACLMLRPLVDELVALMMPKDFRAVGLWYDDFAQTTDAEVTRLLAQASKSAIPTP